MRKVLAAATLALGISLGAATPSSAAPLTLGTWQDFAFGTIGSVNTFDYVSGVPVTIRLVDAFFIGDEFSLSLDGGLGIPTSDASANDGIQSGAEDGDTAFADDRLSKLVIAGASGAHTIDVTHTRNAAGFVSGTAFIRVDGTGGGGDAPEPVSLLLLGGGLVAFAFVTRRRS